MNSDQQPAPMLGPSYRSKADACINAIEALEQDVEALLLRYRSEALPESGIDKAAYFSSVLSGRFDEQSEAYAVAKCSLTHHRDRRSPLEYSADLVLGWLLEDAVVAALESHGGVAVLHGHDRFREFLMPQQISSQPDLLIGEHKRPLEIFADWTGHWSRAGTADLRDSKYLGLRATKALMLCLSPRDQSGCVFDFEHEDGNFRARYIPAYNKEGFSCTDMRERLVPLESAIASILECAKRRRL